MLSEAGRPYVPKGSQAAKAEAPMQQYQKEEESAFRRQQTQHVCKVDLQEQAELRASGVSSFGLPQGLRNCCAFTVEGNIYKATKKRKLLVVALAVPT